MQGDHRLAHLMREAARGRFPPADGEVEFLPSPPGRSDAVVSFTAHNVIAADLERSELLDRLDPTDLGAPMSAEFLAWLAGRLGTRCGVLDLVLVAPSLSPHEEVLELRPREEFLDHPRLARSRRYRTDLRCYSDLEDRALLVVGRGLAERWEMGLEVREEHRGQGLARRLARAARTLVPTDEPLFAQVSPGNTASLHAFLAAGYQPICSEVLLLKRASW